ncbi:hypothetical protein HMPREF1550_00254 [Actinomyces sp. oral taxon 877 str. F0543]|nr:hypothetical protein HMPREF1550_00254 [Actinomyces sp. oral taxon 877 str. F0543]
MGAPGVPGAAGMVRAGGAAVAAPISGQAREALASAEAHANARAAGT